MAGGGLLIAITPLSHTNKHQKQIEQNILIPCTRSNYMRERASELSIKSLIRPAQEISEASTTKHLSISVERKHRQIGLQLPKGKIKEKRNLTATCATYMVEEAAIIVVRGELEALRRPWGSSDAR
jgi:hypothetical protein